MHQYLIGRAETLFRIQTTLATNGLFLLLSVYIVSLPLGIKKILNVSQNDKTILKESYLKKDINSLFIKFFLKSGIQSAVYYFISNTFKKEMKLKFKLIFILAFPVIFFVSEIVQKYCNNYTCQAKIFDFYLTYNL